MKTKLFTSYAFWLLILTHLTLPVCSQVLSSPENPEEFQLTIRNVTQPIDNVLEFEIWLQDTDAAQPLELSTFRIGIAFNNQIMSENPPFNYGHFLIIPGSSQLPEEIQPQNVAVVFSESRIFFRGNYYPPGFGNGFIVPATIPGVRIATIRFINNLFPLVQGTTPDLTFLPNTTAAPSYISFYNQTGLEVHVPIVMGSNAIVAENPLIVAGLCLNPPVAYNISGSLEYCSNAHSFFVELPNTEVGTLYTIFNESGYEHHYTECWGSGLPCIFEVYDCLEYWVLGRNVCGSTLMNGSVDLRYPDESSYIVASDNNVCAGSQVTFRAYNNLPDSVSCLYHWKVNNISTDGNEEFSYTPANGDIVTAIMYYPCEGTLIGSNYITMMVNDCPGNHTTWTGIAGNDWFLDANWSNGIPQSNSIIHIPGGCPDYPILTTYIHNCESIIIEDGGSFIGAENLNEKSAMVKCNITSPDFHFLSSPLSSYSPKTFGEVFPFNQNSVWARRYHELTGNWINKKARDYMLSGDGYSVQLTQPQTAIFIGKLSWGEDMHLVSNHNPGQDPDRVGWNLIGNPNPCSIDWDLMLHDGYENSVYVWNGTQYISWNGSVGALENGIIPPMNGFFVKRNQDWQIKFYFNQSSRVHGNASLYKETPANTLELKVTGEKYSDVTFLHFNNRATKIFDPEFDARKLFGIEEAPQLFSYADGKELSINELPFWGSEVIELGFKCGESGNFSLNSTGLESFNNSVRILLEDTKEGIFQNLSDKAQYSFSYISGESEHRFKLHFTEISSNPEPSEVNIHSVGKTLIINNFTGIIGEVLVYDFTGRMILNSLIECENQPSFTLNVAAGPYVVKVITAKGVQSRKVVIM